MSGTPKYTTASLDAVRQAEQEERRRREREEEARRRAEAEARRRAEQLAQRRSSLAADVDRARQAARGETAHPSDAATLTAAFAALASEVGSADLRSCKALATRLAALEASWQASVARRRREEEEQRRREALERARFEAEEAARALAALGDLSPKHDRAGRAQVDTALAALSDAIRRGSATDAAARARAAVEHHAAAVAAAHAAWLEARAHAAHALDALDVSLAGLAADPVAARWQAGALASLSTERASLAAAFTAERFAEVTTGAQAATNQIPPLLAAANDHQLRANHRDYIAASIAGALEDLGFVVSAPAPEDASHPMTAVFVGGTTAAGRAVGVSVPFDGQVWYDVEGYPEEASVSEVGTPICDQAEAALGELHRILDERFGVQAGELLWEGKDPDRVLRGKDEIGGPAAKAGRTRAR